MSIGDSIEIYLFGPIHMKWMTDQMDIFAKETAIHALLSFSSNGVPAIALATFILNGDLMVLL